MAKQNVSLGFRLKNLKPKKKKKKDETRNYL